MPSVTFLPSTKLGYFGDFFYRAVWAAYAYKVDVADFVVDVVVGVFYVALFDGYCFFWVACVSDPGVMPFM